MSEPHIDGRGLREQKENKWQNVQIKAFTLWINTYLEPLGYKIENIGEDFKNGVNMNIFLEEVSKKKLPRWNKKPAMRINNIENLNIALQFIQKDLGVKLVAIGAEDIADGHIKLTLGVLWSLFKRLRIEVISEEGQSSEMGLLAWLRKMTQGYDGVEIKNFKDSFNDGLAFSALINAMDPEALDFYSIDKSNQAQVIANAFDIAEKKLGIPKLLDVEDLVSGTVDERAVILYSSMFFHAFIADEEKRKLVEQKKSIGEQIAELKAALEKERQEKELLLQQQNQQSRTFEREQDDNSALIARLREQIRQLLEEIAFLKQKALSDSELRSILESKMKLLQQLLDESAKAPISKAELLKWVQKMTKNYPGVDVQNFNESFNDGVAFSALVHALNPTALDYNSIDKSNPETTVNNAVTAAHKHLQVPCNLNPAQLARGEAREADIVEYTTRFFKKFIAEGGISEADLLNWARKTTAGYPNVNIESFKDSFSDGLAFSAILHEMDPSTVDFKSLDPSKKRENLANALDVAQKKFGIPKLITADDILSGKAGESDIKQYTAQLFKTFTQHESAGKRGLSGFGAAGGKKFTKEDLLAWVKDMTADYDNVNIDTFTNSFNDGMALSALIHSMDPDSLDFGSLEPENKKENLLRALDVAQKKFGIPITVDAEDLLSGNPNESEVVAYVAKYFQKFLGESDLFGNPSYGKSGPLPNPHAGDFPPKSGLHGAKFTKADLLKWIQDTTEDYPNVNIKSFEDSFNDGLAFSALIHALDPSAIDFSSLKPEEVQENVNRALSVAEKKLGIPKLVKAEDLINGKATEDEIVAYSAQFFQKYLGDSGLFDAAKSAGLHANKSPETDLLEWVKKVTADYPNVEVNNFTDSFNDGLAFSALIHTIDNDAIDFNSLDPKNAAANAQNALDTAAKKLGVPKLFSAEDLVAGKVDERDIIAYNAKFFKKYLDEVGLNKDGSKYQKADLLNWIKKMTEGYDNVNVKDFTHSFSDGLALAALIHSMDPTAIDFASLNPAEKRANLVNAINTASRRFGIPKFEHIDALLNGTAPEADVVEYTSQFLDRYIAEAGKYGIANSKTRVDHPFAPESDLLQWVKKITEDYDNVEIKSFKASFSDGMAFSALIHSLEPTALDFKALDPADKAENLMNAFAIAESKLGIPNNLNAEKVLNGTADERDIMAYTSKYFQKYLEQVNATKAPFSKADLLKWAKGITADYNNVDINDFKSSFNDGLALAALLHAVDPSAIDFHSLNPKDAKTNATKALDIAEKRFGIPKILNVDQLNAGSADEAKIVETVAKIFEKYIDEAGRYNKLHENVLEREAGSTVTADSERDRALKELEDRKNELLAELENLQRGIQNEIAKRKRMEEEIEFLKKQAEADSQLRGVLENKVNLLQSLIDGATEQHHLLASELDKTRRDREEKESGLNQLETERERLLTDQEEKDRSLRDLEERRNRLLAELADLQRRVEQELARRKEQAAEIASLKKMIEKMTSKQIVQAQAHVGLDALKKNLEEHLEDLYRWRDLHNVEADEGLKDFDLKQVIGDIADKSFEQQLSYLDGRLQEENRNLSRIIKLKDAKDFLNDVVVKAGWLVMKGHKEWKKRWFRLTGDRLIFFEDDTSTEVAGMINLDQGCEVVRQKAQKEEEGSGKKIWPLKVTVGDRKLFVRATNKKERHAWFAAISSKIAHLNYRRYCEETGARPDTRLVGALAAASTPYLDLSDRPLSPGLIAAFVKGFPGRDELESVSISNAQLEDSAFTSLCDVLDKLSGVKHFNFSKNKLTSGITQRFVNVIRPATVIDVNVANNELDDTFLSAVGPALAKGSALNTLVLSGNKFSASGVTALVEAWVADGATVSLQDLVLSNNNLGDAGVKALVPLLKKHAFNKVELAGNGITDEGAVALAEALHDSKVGEVDLSNNRIGTKGAVALKNLMEANTDLHTLDLSNNTQLVSNDESANLFSASGFKFSNLKFSRA